MRKIILVVIAQLFLASTVFALPFLQLDIADGVYDNIEETVFATDEVFTLYALVDPFSDDYIANNTYYIAAAITPKLEESDPRPALGTFSFNGSTVNVTADMDYGIPPSAVIADSSSLGPHGVYSTYYAEFSFDLSAAINVLRYNMDPTDDDYVVDGVDFDAVRLVSTAGDDYLYAVAFEVDVSSLSEEHAVHFDLYNTKEVEGVTLLDKFAPYSHDAESTNGGGGGGDDQGVIPEPSTLILLGAGIVGLVAWRRKKS